MNFQQQTNNNMDAMMNLILQKKSLNFLSLVNLQLGSWEFPINPSMPLQWRELLRDAFCNPHWDQCLSNQGKWSEVATFKGFEIVNVDGMIALLQHAKNSAYEFFSRLQKLHRGPLQRCSLIHIHGNKRGDCTRNCKCVLP